jgi:hypothetical protein
MGKKYRVLPALVLSSLFFYACSVEITPPKRIEIKGNPSYDLLLNTTVSFKHKIDINLSDFSSILNQYADFKH